MGDESEHAIIGYRWESEEGDHECQACAAHNGKEYYRNPQHGQMSMDELPMLPVHPNCRCKLLPLMGYASVLSGCQRVAKPEGVEDVEDEKDKPKPVRSAQDAQNGEKTLRGMVLGSGGRPPWDGPAYGNFGGKNWLGGQNVTGWDEDSMLELLHDTPAIDAMDEACKRHDIGYIRCQKYANDTSSNLETCKLGVDLELVEDLKHLPKDPDQWNRGELPPHEREYAIKFREYATWWFECQVAMALESIDQGP